MTARRQHMAGPQQQPVTIRLRDGTTKSISFICDESDESSDTSSFNGDQEGQSFVTGTSDKKSAIDRADTKAETGHKTPTNALEFTSTSDIIFGQGDSVGSEIAADAIEEDFDEDASGLVDKPAPKDDTSIDDALMSPSSPVSDSSVIITFEETTSENEADYSVTVVYHRNTATPNRTDDGNSINDSPVQRTPSSGVVSLSGSEGPLSCIMCPNPGILNCSRCGVEYCSRHCQVFDFPDHKHLCKQQVSFSEDKRPSENHVLVIVLPRKGTHPEFAWMDVREETPSIFFGVGHPDADWLRQNLHKGINDVGTVGSVRSGRNRWIVAHGCNIAHDGFRDINTTFSTIAGKPSHSWTFVGCIVITASVKIRVAGVTKHMRVDINLRDYCHIVHKFRGRVGNPCVHSKFAAHVRMIAPPVYQEIIPAIKINEPHTINTFLENGMTVPKHEQVLIRPHHFIIETPAPCAIPFLVGLKWYLRAARCTPPGTDSKMPADIALHLCYSLHGVYVGSNRPVGLWAVREKAKGPYVVFQAHGAKIEYAHILALNEYFLNLRRETAPVPSEAGFRDYWDRFKARGIEAGVVAADMQSPYEAQAALAAGLTRVFPDRHMGSNPDRLMVAIRIVLSDHTWDVGAWQAGAEPWIA